MDSTRKTMMKALTSRLNTNSVTLAKKGMRAQAKERQIKALRQLKQTFAPAIAMQARIMQEAAAKLIELHAKMEKKAQRIAGEVFIDKYEVSFMCVKGDGMTEENRPGLDEIENHAMGVRWDAVECAQADAPRPNVWEY